MIWLWFPAAVGVALIELRFATQSIIATHLLPHALHTPPGIRHSSRQGCCHERTENQESYLESPEDVSLIVFHLKRYVIARGAEKK